MTDKDKQAHHLDRIIDNLNQHWHSIQLLLSYVSKPLTVDDRGLRSVIKQLQDQIDTTKKSVAELDLSQTYGEIKFIGERLYMIEKEIVKIRKQGIEKKISVDLTLDGYPMIRNPMKDMENEEMTQDENKKTKTPRKKKILR